MRKISLSVALLVVLALAVPAGGSAGQTPAAYTSHHLDAPVHDGPDFGSPAWLHGLPLDPIAGYPHGYLVLGQDDVNQGGKDQDGEDQDGEDEDGEDEEEESQDDWDKKDLPLKPERTVEFTAMEGSWLSLDVSADGSTVIFDLLGDLYTVPIAGGEATRVTAGMAFDSMPSYSPDGTEVLFVSDRSGSENLWVLRLDEEDEDERFRQVTEDKNSNFASSEWTPDGEYIVASRAGAGFRSQKLYLIHAETGGSGIQLGEATGTVRQMGPAFGADDRWVWFATRTGAWQYNAIFPQYQLAVYDRQTGEVSRRSSRYGSAFRPTLSPDGKRLAYGTRHEDKTGLRLRDLGTGDERWLAYPVQRDDQESIASRDVLPGMSFTPDSAELVASYGGKIWRVPIDGSAAVEIPFTAEVEVEAGPKLDFDYPVDDRPEFEVRQIRDAVPSPDGQQLAFTALDRLYLMDWPDGDPRRLTDADEVEAMPAWSPDGRTLAFITWDQVEGGHIAAVSAAGGSTRRLTTMNGTYRQVAWSPDGERIVAVRGPARDYQESTGPSFGSTSTADLVWIPAGGGDWTRITPMGGRTAPHFGADAKRIYLYAGTDGLVSLRWDGTDLKEHLKVSGPPTPGAEGPPPPANWVKIAPSGDKALARVGMDIYAIGAIPLVGAAAPSISVAKPSEAPVPVRKLTDIGGEFPAWSADGNTVHWSIGNAHVTYDLDEAERVDEEIEAEKKRQAKEDKEEADSDNSDSEDDDAEDEGAEDEGAEDDDADDADAEDADEDKRYKPFEKRVLVMATRDLSTSTVVLRRARVITMNGDEVIDNADIVVEGNRIQAVGRRGRVQIPDGAEHIDLRGKTIVPGFVDTHAHMWPNWGLHKQQVWMYLANLAYGVTTTRDPQTATTDVLTYSDKVETGELIGPRVYSTGPGVFSGERWRDADHARDVLKRYSEYYQTNTIKMYMSGNRQTRQWIINAAREQELMPTTEGGLDLEYNLTMAIDGYPGQEHSLPIYPLYDDVVQLFAQTGITYSPTLVVSYGGPFGENYFYTNENPYSDPKIQRFYPYSVLAPKARRRGTGGGGSPGPGGWFMDEEYAFEGHAEVLKRIVEAGGRGGVGSHGQFDGLGYHWELWMIASGGMSNHDALRVATIHGAEGIGVESDLGSIEPGKIADLVVLDADPLQNIRNTARVHRVMKDGRLYDGATLAEIYPRQREVEGMYWSDSYSPSSEAGIQ